MQENGLVRGVFFLGGGAFDSFSLCAASILFLLFPLPFPMSCKSIDRPCLLHRLYFILFLKQTLAM